MMQCHVNILTDCDGAFSVFEADGTDHPCANGREICYMQAGDRVALSVGKDALLMRRQGDECYSAVFREGEKTRFVLRSGGLEGEIPIYTERYRVLSQGQSALIVLQYALGEAPSLQRFSLQITIKSISEEK